MFCKNVPILWACLYYWGCVNVLKGKIILLCNFVAISNTYWNFFNRKYAVLTLFILLIQL